MDPATVYASVELEGDELRIYPLFDDARFRGTFAGSFEQNGNQVSFVDHFAGFTFLVHLQPRMKLDFRLADFVLTSATMDRYQGHFPAGHRYPDFDGDPFVPTARRDGLTVTPMPAPIRPQFEALLKDMRDGKWTGTDAILVAKDNAVIFEHYFNGFSWDSPHDIRSAQKSITSALVGIGVDQGLLQENSLLVENLPQAYSKAISQEDSAKSKIQLKHLLSMSSGLDAVDFGVDRQSLASEDSYQSTSDWPSTILAAPMIGQPGLEANYGSANPYLAGLMLEHALDMPSAFFQQEYLLEPLGISAYVLQGDMQGRLYTAGGMHMRPRDMLKFGLLHLNHGYWNGKPVLSERWVDRSFRNYFPLRNTSDHNGYGYLWWHHTYSVDGRTIESVEARGAGGQYIFVVPSLDVVVVITSSNYRNGLFQQPESVMRDYVLPALIAE